MAKQKGVTEARSEFRTIVDEVQHKGETYVIHRHGKPAAALVPIEVYESWKQQMETPVGSPVRRRTPASAVKVS